MAATGRDAELRALPSVDAVLAELSDLPSALAVAAAREELAERRELLLAGERPCERELLAAVRERVAARRSPSLRSVINATGVILHTNLGRAPLATEALAALTEAASGYSTLEYRLERGERGSRHDHVEGLLRDLSGAEAAIAVNNNAAAVLLSLAALAAGREVVIGRGQLIEIGGSFRIPEILASSGARLVEVGTTNRTRASDYAAAIGPDTAAIMRVHQSNFRPVGFASEAALGELSQVAPDAGVALIDDLGSGAIAPLGLPGGDEPTLAASVAAGADVVCASGDKLLGGPQAGILAGRAEAIERCRIHPLARALRLDKLQLAALETTLRLHLEGRAVEIPALAMLRAGPAELKARAELIGAGAPGRASVRDGVARPGGGTLPLTELPGPVCSVDPGSPGADALAAALRRAAPRPIVARIEGGEVVLDPRTMDDEDAREAAAGLATALG